MKAVGAYGWSLVSLNPRPSILPKLTQTHPRLPCPKNVAPRTGPPAGAVGAAGAAGGRGKSAYQDRDKPAQIRFSNISAAKGIAPRLEPRPAGPDCALSPPALGGLFIH